MHVIKIDNYYGLTALTGWCEGGGGISTLGGYFLCHREAQYLGSRIKYANMRCRGW